MQKQARNTANTVNMASTVATEDTADTVDMATVTDVTATVMDMATDTAMATVMDTDTVTVIILPLTRALKKPLMFSRAAIHRSALQSPSFSDFSAKKINPKLTQKLFLKMRTVQITKSKKVWDL